MVLTWIRGLLLRLESLRILGLVKLFFLQFSFQERYSVKNID